MPAFSFFYKFNQGLGHSLLLASSSFLFVVGSKVLILIFVKTASSEIYTLTLDDVFFAQKFVVIF